jgi:hypothetical protein
MGNHGRQRIIKDILWFTVKLRRESTVKQRRIFEIQMREGRKAHETTMVLATGKQVTQT